MKKLILLPLILIAMGYYLWDGYVSHKANSMKSIVKDEADYIQNVYAFAKTYREEELKSSRYIGSNGKLDFNIIQNIRVKVDNSLGLLPISEIDTFKNELKYFRSSVDILNKEIIDNNFKNNSISSRLLRLTENKIDYLAKDLPNERALFYNLKKVNKDEVRYSHLESFYNYLISSKKALSNNELKILDGLLVESDATIKDINQKIATGVLSGDYQLTNPKLINTFEKLYSSIDNKKRELLSKIEDKLLKNNSYQNRFFTDIVIVLLLMIFFIIVLFFDKKGISKAKDISEEEHFIDIPIRKEKPLEKTNSKETIKPKKQLEQAENTEPKKESQKSSFKSDEVELMALRSVTNRDISGLKQHLTKLFKDYDEKVSYEIDSDLSKYEISTQNNLIEQLEKAVKYLVALIPTGEKLAIDVESIAEMKSSSAIKFMFKDITNYLEEEDLSILENEKYRHLDKRNEFIDILNSLTKLGSTVKVEDESNLAFTITLKKAT